ncbi:OmpH family outer membrane protein, partial [Porphyromonas loveana]
MKKFFLMLLMALPLSLMAQKVAVVNTEEIITKMPEQVAATKQLNELAEKYRVDLKSMEDELTKKTEEFVKERDGLV